MILNRPNKYFIIFLKIAINYIFIVKSSFCVNNYARYIYSKKSEIITKKYKHKHLYERKTLLSAYK